MAKKQAGTVATTVDSLKPYLDRALTDPEFREDVKEALDAARKLYGPLTQGNGTLTGRASKLATDEKVQENLRKALEELGNAADTLQGKKKKKSRKARKTMLLAGVLVGALYNPWTGPQTREWLLDRIAGDSDLEPLESFDSFAASTTDAAETAADTAAEAAEEAAESVSDTVEDAADGAKRAKK
jgi:hypothetical protein